MGLRNLTLFLYFIFEFCPIFEILTRTEFDVQIPRSFTFVEICTGFFSCAIPKCRILFSELVNELFVYVYVHLVTPLWTSVL
jgi:hypothetical protein